MKIFFILILSFQLKATQILETESIIFQKIHHIEKNQSLFEKHLFVNAKRVSLIDGFDSKLGFINEVLHYYKLESKEQKKFFLFFEHLIKNIRSLILAAEVLSSGEVSCEKSFLSTKRELSYAALCALSSAADLIPTAGCFVQGLACLGLRHLEKSQEKDNLKLFFALSSFVSSESFAAASALNICCFVSIKKLVALSDKEIVRLAKRSSLLWRSCVTLLLNEKFFISVDLLGQTEDRLLEYVIEEVEKHNRLFIKKASSLFYRKSLKKSRSFFRRRSDLHRVVKTSFSRKQQRVMLY